MKCFSFKTINFKHGIFDNSVDCTYIIHLESNYKRLENIKLQLSKYKPTKKLFIYLNKGFKKCKKNLIQQKSNYDIIDSYFNIFYHANKNNYNNILILEDDFILKRVILKEDIININNFCNKNKHNKFMFSLGLLPILYLPLNKNINKSILSVGSHSIIYSKKIRYNLINNKKNIEYASDWDIYLFTSIYKYYYYKPLVYQKFEETENQNNWPQFLGLKYFTLQYLRYLNFKKKSEKAFNIHYKIFFIINIFFYILIIFIIYILLKCLKSFYLSTKKYSN